MFKSVTCAACGKQLDYSKNSSGEKGAVAKCIQCGRFYCADCWEPDFVEICPKCRGMCC